MTSTVTCISFIRLKKRPGIDDILFIIRNDPKKLNKIWYLLKMKLIIEKAMGKEGKIHISKKNTKTNN